MRTYRPEGRYLGHYRSEVDLEKIHTEADLIANLCKKIKQLTFYNFTNTEWEHFFYKMAIIISLVLDSGLG